MKSQGRLLQEASLVTSFQSNLILLVSVCACVSVDLCPGVCVWVCACVHSGLAFVFSEGSLSI